MLTHGKKDKHDISPIAFFALDIGGAVVKQVSSL
jgi:hypothetical protein